MADARERQLAHEAEHHAFKYDKNGRRKASSLPPHHERGTRVVARRR
jgi:hypothetical protein